jgi:predicted Zn-dependent peptidase
MAYTAMGRMVEGQRPGRNSCFMGYIGTQSDKVADAIETFVSLVDSMPQYPERLEVLKTALLQNEQVSKPGFRAKSRVYDYLREMGYTEDPAKAEVEQIKQLTWEQIMTFYQENVQNKPLTIIVMGDPKKIDQKRLAAKFGKIQKVSKGKLFAPLDLEF